MMAIIKIYKSSNLVVIDDEYIDDLDMDYRFPSNYIFYSINRKKSPVDVSVYAEQQVRIKSWNPRPYTEYQDGEGNSFASLDALLAYLDEITGSSVVDSFPGLIDAGNRFRVSQLNTLIDVKQTNDNAPVYIDRENGGTGSQTYVKANGGTEMEVTTTGDFAIAQSKMFAPYFSGKGQFMEITFAKMQNEAGVTKRVGYFSSNTTTPFDSNKDGIWFESDGTNHRFRIQKDGVDVFNQIDTSEIDFSKFNVLVIQFLYLGGTAIRFGFIVNGLIKYFATHFHAGNENSTFVLSPMQPVRYEIRSTGGAGTLESVCFQAASEGSIDEIGVSRAYNIDNFSANSSGSFYAVLGLRLKSDYRNIRIDKEDIGLLATTNDNYAWYLCLNPTIAGTFTFVDQDDSALQVAEGATANTIANEAALGIVLDSGFGTANTQITKPFKNSLRIGSTIAGVFDELVLVVRPFSPNLKIYAQVTINEFL